MCTVLVGLKGLKSYSNTPGLPTDASFFRRWTWLQPTTRKLQIFPHDGQILFGGSDKSRRILRRYRNTDWIFGIAGGWEWSNSEQYSWGHPGSKEHHDPDYGHWQWEMKINRPFIEYWLRLRNLYTVKPGPLKSGLSIQAVFLRRWKWMQWDFLGGLNS